MSPFTVVTLSGSNTLPSFRNLYTPIRVTNLIIHLLNELLPSRLPPKASKWR